MLPHPSAGDYEIPVSILCMAGLILILQLRMDSRHLSLLYTYPSLNVVASLTSLDKSQGHLAGSFLPKEEKKFA